MDWTTARPFGSGPTRQSDVRDSEPTNLCAVAGALGCYLLLRATCATSGACASSRDALRADSDLRAYGPCHRRHGTAGTPELLRQITQPGLGTTSGRLRAGSDVWTSPPPPEPSHEWTMGRRCSWRTRTGATPCNWTDDCVTAGSGPTRQSGARDSESIASQLDAACAGYFSF